MLTEPWGEVNIALEEHRLQLAAYIREHEIDVLLAGPIVSLGIPDAVELDPIPPDTLKKLVEGAILEYVDMAAWEKEQLAEQSEREILERLVDGAA